MMKIARTTSSTIALTIIVIVTVISILAAPIPKAVSFAPYSCSTCGAHESIIGNGLGILTCSNGISYPNTQINFNAIVPVKTIGPSKGTMTLTATLASQIQGTITSGQWDPSTKTYFISGTSTSDNICLVPGSPFTISGSAGSSLISMTGKYDFKGTGDVTASNAKA